MDSIRCATEVSSYAETAEASAIELLKAAANATLSEERRTIYNGLQSDVDSLRAKRETLVGFVTQMTADRAKLFAARLGEDEENGEEATPKESKLGLTVGAVTSEMGERLEIPAGKGVIVKDIKPSSFADDVGLTRGDVILEINKQPVNSEEDFSRISSSLKSGQDVVFLVRQRGAGRQDGTIFLAGTLP